LNDSRKAALPPFDQVKDAVEKSLRERQMAEFQAKLRSAAKIQ
jgi:hypothetical protein